MPLRAAWLALAGATLLASLALDALGLPAAVLFAALVVGLAVALRRPGRLAVGDRTFVAAQAVLGVVLGCAMRADAVDALADAWLPVALVSAATLALSLLAGHVLARVTGVAAPTAGLGMVAGGASGIVAMAHALGGDDRIVAFMQYVRVLIVVLATPLLVAAFFPGHDAAGVVLAPDAPYLGTAGGWAATAGLAVAGTALAHIARLPAGAVLGPLLVAATVALALPHDPVAVPDLARDVAFALLGLHVGLRFTVATIRQIGRLLLPVVASIVALMAGCFALAMALQATTHASLLDAYLATTPGGLYAVLAVAVGSGADLTFVTAVQSLRLLVMVLLAPLSVRLLLRLTDR